MPDQYPNLVVSNLASVLTVETTGVYDTPEGAYEIFIKNTGGMGASTVKILGNAKGSVPIEVALGEAYSYGYIGKGRKSIKIDATGTTAEISITV